MKKQKEIRSAADRIFDGLNVAILIIAILICAYPIYYTIIASFSDPNLVITGKVFLWIKDFTLDSYKEVIRYKSIIRGYRNTIIYTLLATTLNLIELLPASYALSKKQLKGRRILNIYFMFTMYFSGGMIPQYLLYKSLGLVDNPLVMIIPGAFGVYNMLITRTFYESNFSESLAEAARIDGAGEVRIFFQLALPLSGAIIAVMALYNGVAHWNQYFDALLYIRNNKYYPLQLIMRQILTTTQNATSNGGMSSMSAEELQEIVRHQRTAMTMRYALVILANIPVFVAYPFVQKYFVKGVMIGAVKG